MSLVKVKFKNGTIKEISEHLAIKPELQKSQGFVILNEQGEELPPNEFPIEEKKSVEVAEVEIIAPVQSVTEIVNPLEETQEETTEQNEVSESVNEVSEPKKRGRKPKQ